MRNSIVYSSFLWLFWKWTKHFPDPDRNSENYETNFLNLDFRSYILKLNELVCVEIEVIWWNYYVTIHWFSVISSFPIVFIGLSHVCPDTYYINKSDKWETQTVARNSRGGCHFANQFHWSFSYVYNTITFLFIVTSRPLQTVLSYTPLDFSKGKIENSIKNCPLDWL